MIELIVSNPNKVQILVSEIQTPIITAKTHVSWFDKLVSWAGGIIVDWRQA